jgi:hypothetical protein
MGQHIKALNENGHFEQALVFIKMPQFDFKLKIMVYYLFKINM